MKPKNKPLILALGMAVPLLLGSFAENYSPDKQPPRRPSYQNQYLVFQSGYRVLMEPLGSKAPEAPGQRTIDYRYVPLMKSGKIAIWHFFSSTCPHCEMEMPALEKFYRAHKKDIHLVAFGVASGNDKKTLRSFKKRLGLSFAIIPFGDLDLQSPIAILGICYLSACNGDKSCFTCSVPATVIIDQNGVIRYITHEPGDWATEPSLEQIVLEELTGKTREAKEHFAAFMGNMGKATAEELNTVAWAMAMSQFHLNEARKLAEKAVSENANNPYYMGTLGVIQYLTGDYDQARNNLEKSTALHQEIAPKAIDSFYLGLVYLAKQDYCKARGLMEKSVELAKTSQSRVYMPALKFLADLDAMKLSCVEIKEAEIRYL